MVVERKNNNLLIRWILGDEIGESSKIGGEGLMICREKARYRERNLEKPMRIALVSLGRVGTILTFFL